MKVTGVVAGTLVLALASTTLAQELPPGYGTSMPTGSKVTTTLGNGIDVAMRQRT